MGWGPPHHMGGEQFWMRQEGGQTILNKLSRGGANIFGQSDKGERNVPTRAIGDRMSATSAISKVISIQFCYFYHGGSGTLQRTPNSKYFVLMIF